MTLCFALYWFTQAVCGSDAEEKDYNSSDYSNGSTNSSSVDGDILDGLDGGATEVAAPATGSVARRTERKFEVAIAAQLPDADAPTVAPWKPVGQERG